MPYSSQSDVFNLFQAKPAMPDAAGPEYVGEAPDGAASVKRAIAISKTFPAGPPDGCYRCEQELYISFFFDGFGHDQKIDAHHGTVSNIGRLFDAHKIDTKKGIYKLYYEGLGTRLSDDPVTVGALAHGALAPLNENAEDIAKDKARAVTTDPYKKTLAEAIRTKLNKPGTSLSRLAAHSEHVAAEQLDRDKVWEKITDWKEVVKSKWASAGFGIIAEMFPPIRDSEASAALLGTGVDARVDKATENFKKIVNDAKQDLRPIKHIKIAVFGYDRGALVARTFAKELLEKTCKQVKGEPQYQGITIDCQFMGLFDSVSASYADTLFTKLLANAIGAVPLGGITNRVVRYIMDGALQVISLAKRTLGAVDVPEEFKCAVHYVAANELRFYKRADSLRKSQSAERVSEVVFPGTQPDIGGGARNGDGGKSNELAKLVARCMHQEAWSHGVPFLRLDQLASQSQATAREFRSAQPISVNGRNCTVDDLFQAYLAYVQPTGPLEKHFMAHQQAFISYLRQANDKARRTSNGQHFSDRAAFEYQVLIDNSGGRFEPEMGVVVEMPGTSANDIAEPNAKTLGQVWESPQSLPLLVTAFFDHVFHNTITEPLDDAALNCVSYFMLRPIEDLPKPAEPLPAPIPGVF